MLLQEAEMENLKNARHMLILEAQQTLYHTCPMESLIIRGVY